VASEYSYIGKSLQEVEDLWRLDIDVIDLYRDGETVSDKDQVALKEGDILRIRGNAKEIDKLIRRRTRLEVHSSQNWEDAEVSIDSYELLEAVVAPESEYDNQKIKDIDLTDKYEAVVLGVYHRGKNQQETLGETYLDRGDSILLAMRERRIPDLRQDSNFVIVSDVSVDHYKRKKIPIALSVLAAVVITAALNIVPIAVSACTGVILMVLTGCLRVGDIYKAITIGRSFFCSRA
jgi:uncharacterized protein with PhoU and TrkA domain